MEFMERNWLIRTSQNQLLGPVAKQKLLEFIEKGALGLTDEITSGNGYWFSLREKELVDKYIYGDIPQGYNPISESKSVLARRESPEKTTSINSSPANKEQLVKPSGNEVVAAIPSADDLEFPDIGVVAASSKSTTLASQVEPTDVTKLPSADDLEFPDITLVATSRPVQMSDAHGSQTVMHSTPTVAPVKKERPPEISVSTSNESAVYPKDDDLDFPDVESIKNAVKEEVREKTSEFEFKVDTSHTQTIAIKKEEVKPAVAEQKKSVAAIEEELSNFGENTLTLVQPSKLEKEEKKPKEAPLSLDKKTKREQPPVREEDKKLLHDRKVRSSQSKMPARENREVVSIDNAPTPLKKRNDNYIFFILIILVLILLAIFFYFKEILNKPLPV